MGQQRKRPIGRPRKAILPDPTDPSLRRWVFGLTPERMHREVCARLRGRTDLEREAFAAWTLAGFPGWLDHQAEMPLALRFHLAERLTITSPTIPAGFSLIPLLPFGTLVDPGPACPVPGIPTRGRLAAQQMIADFRRQLIHGWWQPLTRDAERLAKYEDLHTALTGRRARGRTLWEVLGIGRRSPSHVLINGRSYRVPTREKRRANPKPEPSELAILFLARGREGNERSIKRELAHARMERHIAAAWAQYIAWLHAHAAAQAELDRLLSSISRASTLAPKAPTGRAPDAGASPPRRWRCGNPP